MDIKERITKKLDDYLNLLADMENEEHDIKHMLEDYPHLKDKYMDRIKQNEVVYRHFHGKSGFHPSVSAIHPSFVGINVVKNALQHLISIKEELIRDIDKIEANEYRKKKSSKAKPKRKIVKKCKCK